MNEKILHAFQLVEDAGFSAGLAAANLSEQSSRCLDAIIQVAERVSVSKSIPAEFQNCAGNFLAGHEVIAIIGEKPAKVSKLKRSYPFADVDGCSGWLNSQLSLNGISESGLFWVNAVNLDGSFNDPEIINQLQPKEIICLGKTAAKWANKNGWEHIMFYHPQYWKRFKSSEPYPFIEYLSNACVKS